MDALIVVLSILCNFALTSLVFTDILSPRIFLPVFVVLNSVVLILFWYLSCRDAALRGMVEHDRLTDSQLLGNRAPLEDLRSSLV